MFNSVIVHYSEIALKGQNRNYFEKKLSRNIKEVLPAGAAIKRLFGRFVVRLPPGYDKGEISSALSRVCGISNFSFAAMCGRTFEELKNMAIQAITGMSGTFKVIASGRSFELGPSEIERQLGAAIVEKCGLKAKMVSPDITVFAETFDSVAYIYLEKIPGPGGLPVGSSGRVIELLSGGIDSPVAAALVAKRGCRPLFVHFHALRSNEEAAKSKIVELIKKLLPYCQRTKVYYVPYSIFQISTTHIPGEYELIIFRRFMNRVAEVIAQHERAKAIVTGESIGQVASQTLDNIMATEEVTKLPVIRPLITFDKEEIISEAKKIGTYEISIADYKDCCSIITRHPKTRPSIDKIKSFESTIDMAKIVQESLNASTVIAYKYGKGNIESKEVPMPRYDIMSSDEHV